MRLFFTKNERGDVEVQIEKGTSTIPFSYIEMLRQLLQKNEIADNSEFSGLEDEEVSALKSMLSEICKAVDKGLNEGNAKQS